MAGPVERCQVPPKPGCISCEDIVRKWYSEKKNYDFQKGAPISVGQSTSHFNQVILFLMIISLINTYSCTYIFFFPDTSMCMAAKKRKAYLRSAADFLGLQFNRYIFRNHDNPSTSPGSILPCCCCFFFWPQIAPFEVKYFYFIANELHFFRLIHSDISLNMDQCYISVLLPYLWYIVV